jgi:capsular exopolysaccharide synthesis family protein
MDTIDRPDSNVPARYPADSPRMPAPTAPSSRDLAVATPAPSSPQVTPRILVRGLSRHWWRIMLFWLLLSAPLAILIYAMVEPTYEAVSLLRADPSTQEIYNPSLRPASNLSADRIYLLTQVKLITSNQVLDAALANPAIANQPMIRASKDPKATLRDAMRVEIVGQNTYLLEVALSSKDPAESAAIVNAVVKAYTDQHAEYHQKSNRALRESLKSEQDRLGKQLLEKEDELNKLINGGNVNIDLSKNLAPVSSSKADDAVIGPSFKTVTQAQYSTVAQQLINADMKIIEVRASRDTARTLLDEARKRAEEVPEQPAEDPERKTRIEEEFLNDPDVRALTDSIQEAKEAREQARRKARDASDPSVVAADREYKARMRQWEDLWREKREGIEKRVAVAVEDVGPKALEAKVADLDMTVARLTRERDDLRELLRKMEVKGTTQNAEQFKAASLHQDLEYLRRLRDTVSQKLSQLDFEIGQVTYKITVQDKAIVPVVPENNKRIKYMAVAPVGVLFFMLGLFLLIEVRAERVADPEALSTRVHSEVYALPPLPTARAIRRRGVPDADDQIEQFIQRLDHLRFAVCGSPSELEKGRCVLITSAIGGEGKTTLAAQLAARCGNAGMSTLLIDADLRRTSLCSLLDVPEGPGLSDALEGDDPPPTELIVPVQGGTFHLLPAGTPVTDTSRVLQNRKLGLLIAQFRQLYDLVIIDSPPVLPVPDALILGRWADGAVLAVRYDISRFPQVERARRQLDGAGIAVLGTVINGMKNSESYYGRYSYGRRRSSQADPSAAL